MEACRRWLRDVQEHEHDEYWLDQHGDEIYLLIQSCLSSPPKFEQVVDILLIVFPYYALQRSDILRWTNLLIEALLIAQTIGDDDLQIRLMQEIGQGRLVEGHYETARFAFLYVLEHAQYNHYDKMALAAHIGLIALESLHQTSYMADSFIRDALTLAHSMKDPALLARLHLVLCSAYAQLVRPLEALQYGQMAYAYWHSANNPTERGKAAYALASVYRFINKFDLAEEYLAIAEEMFSHTSYRRQYTLTIYERGVLFSKRGQYDEAVQWLEQAFNEASLLGINYLIASTRHALGFAQFELRQFDQAQENLKNAVIAWKTLKNSYQQANVYCGMACLEIRRGDQEQAGEWLRQARRLLDEVPQQELRDYLEKWIENAEAGQC